MNRLQLLLVDDDELEARVLGARIVRGNRVAVTHASSGPEALTRLEARNYDAVVTDLVMPAFSGLDLVREVKERDASLPVIIMTAHAAVDRAVEGMQAGAADFLQKPVSSEALGRLVDRMAQRRAGTAPQVLPRDDDPLLGHHPLLDDVRRFAAHLARVPGGRVLITGESGTGKSLLARRIHALSRVSGEFVDVNCAALPPALLESELFGHEKGAFTDAKARKLGLIETAQDGTLFLDEIGSLPSELQAKLLRFLDLHEIRRVGGTRTMSIRTRVIAATNDDLHARVRAGSFRGDLLYRLDVASIEMPTLRSMPEIIPDLAARLVVQIASELRRPPPRLTAASFEGLTRHHWPGNVRQLRNTIERALIFHPGGPFRVESPRADSIRGTVGDGLVLARGLTLEEVERRYLEITLRRSGSRDYARIAHELGISRKTLWDKRRRYGLDA